jgi:fructokinase
VRYGAIEAGGTKFVVAAGTGPSDLSDPTTVATTTPDDTIGAAIEALRRLGPLDAVGIASFGPIDLRPGSATEGRIVATPKPGWSGTDIVGRVRAELGVPVAFDVDVNGSAMGEGIWGAGRGLDTFVYLTVGTGIGGGAMVEGTLLHGLNHPEMGHLVVPRHPDDGFAGSCPFHGGCLEGMAAGPAIEARWGRRPDHLGDLTASAVALEAWYLGTGLADLTLALAPQRLIVGGGVMRLPGLIDAVRSRLLEALGGYVTFPEVRDVSSFVVPPGLGDRAGVLGAIALARQASAGSAPDGGQ